ncbi:hypothetical protein PLANPX_4192 [Lacipirellula parvula]|uniref:Uncharacterized protein n=1 Tax=Lacipirellula parvula TaxID=2650471 RepID=A0A5K7XCM7_9BACT|nr:hypothetical protein PLANPX_4192 [Lacipirellula parvula]
MDLIKQATYECLGHERIENLIESQPLPNIPAGARCCLIQPTANCLLWHSAGEDATLENGAHRLCSPESIVLQVELGSVRIGPADTTAAVSISYYR